MELRISLSFKLNEKDMFDFVKSQLSGSIYIKGLIKNDMEKSSKETTNEPKRKDIFNF